jgi:thioredoxin-like negative regulator of GroEL
MKDLDLYELACGMTELDIDDENGEELQQQYQIKTIPTLILLQDGKEISRLANSKSTLQEIKDWINQ